MQLLDRAAHLKGDAAFAKRLDDTAQKIEEIRRKIVATKEGGAVTGEERIREKTTALYGNILNYDGPSGRLPDCPYRFTEKRTRRRPQGI